MGSRVAFVGGSMVNRDHFPLPVIDGTPTEFNPFFLRGIAFESVMFWTWVVKRWKMEGTIGWSIGSGLYNFEITILDTTRLEMCRANPLGGDALIISSESEIVAQPFFQIANLDYTSTNDLGGVSDPVISPTGVIFIFNNYLDTPIGYQSGETYPFLPSIGILFHIDGDDGVEGFELDITGATAPGNIESGFIQIDGWEFDVDCGYTGSADESSLNIDIALTPVEYWPYATKPPASLPVYNTSTGAILNDPFS